MPTVYQIAEAEVWDVFRRVLQTKFPVLNEADLRFELLAAFNPDGPAVKLHGAAALATIKVIGPEERAKGAGDLRIKIDAERYERMRPRTREAIFAHELYHVVLARKKNGALKLDPYERPVTRLRPDDWCMTGFKEVADWYGEDSVERISYQNLGEILRQSVFEFVSRDDDAPAVSPDVAEDTIAALVSVGHHPERAREMVDAALAAGKPFRSVSAMIDEIYRSQVFAAERAAAAQAGPDATDRLPIRGEANAEILAGVCEAEAAQAAEANDDEMPADHWRTTPLDSLGFAERTLERLQEPDVDIHFLGELVALWYERRVLDSVLIGRLGNDVEDCLRRFHSGLPQHMADDFAKATNPATYAAEAPPRRRREKATA